MKRQGARNKEAERLFWAELGLRIAIARDTKGFTQTTLARRIGISRTSVANIEAGRQRVDCYGLRSIAQVIGCGTLTLLPKARP